MNISIENKTANSSSFIYKKLNKAIVRNSGKIANGIDMNVA